MKQHNTLYSISRSFISGYAKTMLDMNIVRAGGMPEGAKIIAANHPTTTDPFFMLAVADTRIHILVTESAFKVPLMGKILLRCGHIPVVAKNGRAAFDAALELLRAGHTIAIFPEGALSPLEGGLLPARTGTLRLALETNSPIVPVGIALLKERIRHKCMVIDGVEEHARWYLNGPYAVTVGAPLRYRGDVTNHDEVHRLSQNLMCHIRGLARQSKYRLLGRALAIRETAELPAI
jgi:1-acyl-sn-glycerol-3-phosphate acyltransferase